jgi:hypothetical protein
MATVSVTPEQNALDSLRRFAAELKTGLDYRDVKEALAGILPKQVLAKARFVSPMGLKGPLTWGWHTTAMLVYMRLQPHRVAFDAWVQDYLDTGEPVLDIERDAHWENRKRFTSLEMLDLLSDTDLQMLEPEFYQGWQDKATRCKTIRTRVREIVGGSIGDSQRQQLLLLLAAYHRLVRLPAAVELDVATIRDSLPALFALWELLVDKSSSAAPEMLQAIEQCKMCLQQG